MARSDADRIDLYQTYPSVVAGVFAIAVFALCMMVLSSFSGVDVRSLLVPFTAGFLVFMLFYFLVMVFVEPYVRW